jgi:hypothetical protein
LQDLVSGQQQVLIGQSQGGNAKPLDIGFQLLFGSLPFSQEGSGAALAERSDLPDETRASSSDRDCHPVQYGEGDVGGGLMPKREALHD